MSKTHNDYPLISAIELEEILGKENIKIFDIRGKWGSPPMSSYDDFANSHIPGAVYLDWTRHFLEPDIPINLAPVASKAIAREAFKELGISSNDSVILYDDYHHMLAGRVWWAMRYWGFDNVKVLDGGWPHWSAKNFPVATDICEKEEGSFTASAQSHLRVSTEDVKNRPSSVSLIDARGPINFQGDPSDPTSGHIPGALNIPYSSLLDPQSGLFKDAKSLEMLLCKELKGLDKASLISSCGSGYAGTVLLLALKAIGIEASLYDGSIAAWKETGLLATEQGSALSIL